MKDRIIQHCTTVFKRLGIRIVSMDEIALQLGISKKTLYQHFKTKEEIVREMIIRELDVDKCQVHVMASQGFNPIEGFIRLATYFIKDFNQMNPVIFYEIKKYYPDVWALYADYRDHFAYEQVSKNILEGIEAGLYRKDFDLDLAVRFHIGTVDMIFSSPIFQGKNVGQAFGEHVLMYLYGIATPEGIALINQHRPMLELELRATNSPN
jgi:TetR/AcrR family transcriptional regulator, cholesterol catabolism regulator